jgi:hypothetical protein
MLLNGDLDRGQSFRQGLDARKRGHFWIFCLLAGDQLIVLLMK